MAVTQEERNRYRKRVKEYLEADGLTTGATKAQWMEVLDLCDSNGLSWLSDVRTGLTAGASAEFTNARLADAISIAVQSIREV